MPELADPPTPAVPAADAPPRPAAAIPRLGAAGLFVGGIWLLMTASTLAFVGRYAIDAPFLDEWDFLPALTAEAPDVPGWLWTQHNEHLLPVPRLIYWALGRLTGWDFRAGAYVTLAALAGLALACVLTARRLRGHVSYADAFFPLALLHIGQFENLLWGYQLGFGLSVLLVGLMLQVIVRTSLEPYSWRAVGLTAVCLPLLPLCGMHAFVYLPPLALWLILVGWHGCGHATPGGRRRGAALLAVVVLSFGVTAATFLGYHWPGDHPAPPDALAVARVAAQVLATGAGWPGVAAWPGSGFVVVGLLAAAALLALRVALGQRAERLRALGLVLFLAGGFGLALGIGWGRASFGPTAGFAGRYFTLALPPLCALYFVAALYGGRLLGGFVPMALFAGACALAPANHNFGTEQGGLLRHQVLAFHADLKAGMPASVLARRYTGVLHPSPEAISRGLLGLHRLGVRDYAAGVRPDEPLVSIPMDARAARLTRAAWDGGSAYGRGADSSLDYFLPAPRPVEGIRLRCRYTPPPAGTPCFSLFWKSSPADADEHEQHVFLNPQTGEGECDVLFWPAGPVASFRLVPDIVRPWACEVSGLELLLGDSGR
jgi:hypothetical protein